MLLIKSGCFFFITHVYKISDAEGCNFCGRIFVYFCLFVRLYTCTRLLLFLLWTYFRIFYFYQAFQTVLDYIHNILSPLHSYTFRVVFFVKNIPKIEVQNLSINDHKCQLWWHCFLHLNFIFWSIFQWRSQL